MRALPLYVVLVVVLVAAVTDLWKFRIYNALTIPSCLLGLLYHWSMSGSIGLVGGVLGVLVANVPFIPLYVMGGMGAGDMKLMAVVGSWLGPWAMLHVIVVSGLAAGCYSLVLMVWNRLQHGVWLNEKVAHSDSPLGERHWEGESEVAVVLSRPDRRRNAVPFGVLVALGVIVTARWIEWPLGKL
jgi:prepilin peptidase CpaA